MSTDLEFDTLFLVIKLGKNEANLRENGLSCVRFGALGDANFTEAFKLTDFVKEAFLELPSVLNLMFFYHKFYRYFLVITIINCNSLF